MIRGFLFGGLWGAVVGAVVLALTSQLADWRDLTPAIAEGDTGETTPPVQPEGATEAAPSVVASAEVAPRVEEGTPQVNAGQADEITAPMLDTSPPNAPDAGEASGALIAEVEVSDAPVLPTPVDAPGTETAAGIEIAATTEAGVPPKPGEPALAPASSAPDATAEITPPEAPAAPSTTTVDLPEDAIDADIRIAALPATTEPEASTDSAPATPATPDPVAQAPAVEPVEVPAEDVATDSELPTVVDDQPQTANLETAPSSDTPQAEAQPVLETTAPAAASVVAGNGADQGTNQTPQIIEVETREATLPGAQSNTLPRIGDQPTILRPGAEDTASESEAAEPEAPEVASGAPALERNRAAFEPPAGAGLIAVVLIHESGKPMDLPSSDALPVPLTVGIPAAATDAAQAAKAYRDAGYEVALIPDLPPRATAQDVEVALPINLEAIPYAVAIMDAGGSGFQNDRGATESVIATLVETGHGILTWPKGLNTAQKLAVQEGIPSALVFRQLVAGSSGAVVRALDQAAFRARQDGGIVMVADGDAAIVEGLVQWSADTLRSDTALAPLSAVLSGR